MEPWKIASVAVCLPLMLGIGPYTFSAASENASGYLMASPRLRTSTELARNSITLPEFSEHRCEDQSRFLRAVSSIMIIVLSLHWKRMTGAGALAGIVVGKCTVLVWVYSPLKIADQPLGGVVYEIVPGFVFSTVAIIIVSLSGKTPSPSIVPTFDELLSQLGKASRQSAKEREVTHKWAGTDD